eukprot:TRINITY_DN30868_c0_g1_i1.p2 TRINITY_DN30868_c0_g1~~TRINITY_DN30868_c0_g1_i1.p2  ORF type:complete len:236 (+),score=80.54 TRINITY_DN30868_c0_g1_i1:52-759(+)
MVLPPAPAECTSDETRWRSRLAQLLEWATGEEREDGDIHFSLSCYTEAVLLLHRRVAAVGVDEATRAAAKPLLQAWGGRALLLRQVIQEMGIEDPGHPFTKPVPGVVDEGAMVPFSVPDAVDDDTPVDPAAEAAAALDLPLPPACGADDALPEPSCDAAWCAGEEDEVPSPASCTEASAALGLPMPPTDAPTDAPSAPPISPPEHELHNAAFQQFVRQCTVEEGGHDADVDNRID